MQYEFILVCFGFNSTTYNGHSPVKLYIKCLKCYLLYLYIFFLFLLFPFSPSMKALGLVEKKYEASPLL